MTTELFNRKTQAIIYGFQRNAIQRMLDFDFVCKRETPSVAAIIRPSQAGAIGYHKVFWGGKEIVIPIYRKLALAVKKHPEADVLINFSSFRSAYPTSKEALNAETIKTVAIIAEGIPERRSRELRKLAEDKGKVIIGPATVGGIQAGAFKIGNTAGTIENVVLSKLYRPGSVGFVSKSGGMSNEMNFAIAQNSDGIYEGIAIGGDRYAGSTLLEHLLRYEANPKIKMMVALGEVGGTGEIDIVNAVKDGRITKPLVIYLEDRITEETLSLENVNVIIVEGTYTSVLKNVNTRIFIDLNYEDTKQSRLKRAREKQDNFLENVLKIEHNIISNHKNKADLIITKDFDILEKSDA